MIRSRKQTGFTLVEVMVATVVVGILASIAVPNYVNAAQRSKTAAVKSNMHTVQVTAELYATEAVGHYPATAAGLDSFFPGGGMTIGGAAGHRPNNPITNIIEELPFAETISDSATIAATRVAPPSASPGTRGSVGYAQCDAPQGTSYCVTGADDVSLRIPGPNSSTLVLSNQ